MPEYIGYGSKGPASLIVRCNEADGLGWSLMYSRANLSHCVRRLVVINTSVELGVSPETVSLIHVGVQASDERKDSEHSCEDGLR